MNSKNYFELLKRKNKWYLIHNRVTDKYLIVYNLDIASLTYSDRKFEYTNLEEAAKHFNKI